jgi:hydroxymethylglutaryl-CoA lyase
VTPDRITIVEVGPRDGLQNETAIISPQDKIRLIQLLAYSGLQRIEAGSFVTPKAAPQMASTSEVLARLQDCPARLSVLVPNLKGLDAALAAGVQEIAVFAAASESFCRRNINCSIAESIERYGAVVREAQRHGVMARGYVSCALGCPYEGSIDPTIVVRLTRQLLDLGCYEVALGDTIGVGVPAKTRALVEKAAREVPLANLAVHFHDTYGQALANIYACIEAGISTIDASIAGLGGCPFAPGATGNVATEDVVYMLNASGVVTGVDLDALLSAGDFISARLNRPNASRAARALKARLGSCLNPAPPQM